MGGSKQIHWKKRNKQGRIKAKSPQERVKKWKNLLLNLLGQPPVIRTKETETVLQHTQPINANNFTMEELNKCRSLKNNKPFGLDNIPIDVWKTAALNMQLLAYLKSQVCSRTLNRNRAKIWVKSGIIPFPKKADLQGTGNYCAISLTVVAAKVYNNLLLERIRSHLDPLLKINQNGFCPGRSTVAQI